MLTLALRFLINPFLKLIFSGFIPKLIIDNMFTYGPLGSSMHLFIGIIDLQVDIHYLTTVLIQVCRALNILRMVKNTLSSY